MMSLDYIREVYSITVDERADPRTKEWFLVYSPWGPIAVAVVYNLFCWNARALTKNLPAISMRPIIVLYNFMMVILSSYMTFEFFITAYLSRYNLLCQPVDYTSSPLALRMARVCWWYFFSKYIELIETVFFALRKKYNQISFLHVYHHTSMLFIWWFGIKYVPGGQSFLFGVINSFVHVVMYAYYGLSAIGPFMQNYLWWKKYITMLQLSQFFILAFFTINNLVVSCDFPTWLNRLLFVYAITLGVLFLNFYFKAYNKRPQVSSKQSVPTEMNGDSKSTNGYHKSVAYNDTDANDQKLKMH